MFNRFRFLRIVLLAVLLFLLPTACKFSLAKNSSNSGSPVFLLSSGKVGETRSSPIPIGKQISIPGWDVEVREFLRGQDALKIINSGDWQPDPLPDGKEYVLAKVFVRCTSMDESYHDLSISEMFITGEKDLAYGDSLDGWPQPEFLFEDMYTAEAVEGWVDAVVPADEKNMELVLDVWDGDTRYTRYFELDKGASISMPQDLASLTPNTVGQEVSSPARLNEQVITPDWSVTLLESIRGQEAEAILQNGNDYYQPPSEGLEHLLLKVELTYHSTSEAPTWVSSDSFFAEDSSGVIVQGDTIYPSADRVWIANTVLPGASLEGWIALNIPAGEQRVAVIFNPDRFTQLSDHQNYRYFEIQ